MTLESPFTPSFSHTAPVHTHTHASHSHTSTRSVLGAHRGFPRAAAQPQGTGAHCGQVSLQTGAALRQGLRWPAHHLYLDIPGGRAQCPSRWPTPSSWPGAGTGASVTPSESRHTVGDMSASESHAAGVISVLARVWLTLLHFSGSAFSDCGGKHTCQNAQWKRTDENRPLPEHDPCDAALVGRTKCTRTLISEPELISQACHPGKLPHLCHLPRAPYKKEQI